MSRTLKDNYLTKQNGCLVIEATSQRQNAPASNILSSNPKQLWIINEALPQHCIVNTSGLKQYTKVFNRVGFYCWHEYESNPELIQIAYSKTGDGDWVVVGKVRLQMIAEKQYFKIKDIPVTEMKFLRLSVVKNYGDKNTYLNQVQLGFAKEAQAEPPAREKTMSEFMKLTSTQRQLKRALEQIKSLRGDQEDLKATVVKQSDLICKMQEEFKLLVRHNEKILKVQELQTIKIQELEGKMRQERGREGKERSRDYGRRDVPYRAEHSVYPVEFIDSSDEDRGQKRFIEQQFMQKKTVSSKANKSLSHTRSNKQNLHKGQQIIVTDPRKNNLVQKMLRSRQIEDTEPNLSEYDSQNERSMHSEKCTELVTKLQRLLAERVRVEIMQEKRSKENSRRSRNRQS